MSAGSRFNKQAQRSQRKTKFCDRPVSMSSASLHSKKGETRDCNVNGTVLVFSEATDGNGKDLIKFPQPILDPILIPGCNFITHEISPTNATNNKVITTIRRASTSREPIVVTSKLLRKEPVYLTRRTKIDPLVNCCAYLFCSFPEGSPFVPGIQR